MPTSSRCRATSLPTPRCRPPWRPAPATPTCASTASSTRSWQLRDGELETSVVDREVGLAVRVIVDGTWGFASHAELDADVAAETARRAVQVARTLAPLNAETIELAPEPVYADVSWVSDYRIDPFAIPAADKIGLLAEYSGRLLAADGVNHVSASLHAVKEQTFYADTAGSSITQQRVRVQPTLEARRRRRRGGILRDHAHAGAADRAGLGGRRRRRRVGLVGGARGAADAARREGQGAERDAEADRPRHRPVEPVADHPRIHRARHRIRPRDRLRGRLRGHVVRHAGQAGHDAVRLTGDERDRRPHRGIRAGHRRVGRRGCAGAAVGSGARRHLRRLPA